MANSMWTYNPAFAPLARIVLRYVVGAGLMGSEAIGDTLSANPDIVLVTGILMGVAVEGLYWLAKRNGMVT